MVQAEGWKKHENTVYWVDIKLAQKKWFKFYETRLNAIILHDTLPACCIPKFKLENSNTRKYMRHLFLLQRFLLKTNGWKNWVQMLLEVVKTLNKTQPLTKNSIVRTGRLVRATILFECSRNQKTCLTWLRNHRWKDRVTCFPVVCQCLLSVQIKTKTQTKP